MNLITLNQAITYLNQGDLVAIPTETVYGLAANALNPKAVDQIFKVKGRPSNNPLILHFYDLQQALPYLTSIPDDFHQLYHKYCPGPLSFLISASSLVPNRITAGNERVAIRFPQHPITRELLKELPFPLAAPSANKSGYISPIEPYHVWKQFGTSISGIIDGGKCTAGLESTIVGWSPQNEVIIYRSGTITQLAIETTLAKKSTLLSTQSKKILAPGMLSKHYAPKKPCYFFEEIEDIPKSFLTVNSDLILQNNNSSKLALNFNQILHLSTSGDLVEAATKLYAYLHLCDESNSTSILIQKAPNQGIGMALNDRIQRAGKSLT